MCGSYKFELSTQNQSNYVLSQDFPRFNLNYNQREESTKAVCPTQSGNHIFQHEESH